MTQHKFAPIVKMVKLIATSGTVSLWQRSGICQPGLREPTVAWSEAKACGRCASGRNPLEQQVSRGTDAAPDEGAACLFRKKSWCGTQPRKSSRTNPKKIHLTRKHQ